MWRVLGLTLMLVSISAFGGVAEKPATPVSLLTSGPIEREVLIAKYPQFKSSYEQWEPGAADVAAMQALQGKAVKVILGLWCSDSHREVPRFIKLLERSGVTLLSLEMVTVDRQKNDPKGVAKQYEVKYVPTIIVLEGDRELGRFVESPKGESMAQELAAIASNN